MKKWTLSWGENVWTEDDLTVGDLALAQELTGDGWRSADPLRGPTHAANLLAILVARAESRPLNEVCVELAGLSATALADALGVAEAA